MSTPNLLIRDEAVSDYDTISKVTEEAFRTLEVSGHTEEYVVLALRKAGALSISLVAELAGMVVGHIAFSPVSLSDGTPGWYGLGPVSVLPELQKLGIGKALIREGLARLKALGARGCVLVGHPGYYTKFGFHNTPTLSLEGVPPEVFFALSFDGHIPQGTVTFHPAFGADEHGNGQ
ncbi:MAG: N-acetyltransferase [Anaerolineaceae bacterium]|nr:N-acetyltransferase [Anaerolineaceae bacterium]